MKKLDSKDAKEIGEDIGIDWSEVKLEEFTKGVNVEFEHGKKFNNRSLGMVKLEMEVASIPDLETDMLNPDFVKIAEAIEMTGIGIDDPGDGKIGIRKSISA